MGKQYSDLNQMSLFASVVDLGSFTATAQELDVSKSYVSKKVSHLESELGVQLLRRTTRRLHLTEEGERFLGYCLQVVSIAEEAWKTLQHQGTEVAGPLRISAPITYGQLFVPEFIEEFCRLYPRVRADLVLENRPVRLLSENFDIAFRITENPPQEQARTRVGTMTDIVCASPTMFAAGQLPNQPAQLRGLPCLLYINPERIKEWVFRKNRRVELIEVDGSTAYSHHGALLRPLLAGRGVAKVPLYFVSEYLKTGQLIQLLPDYDCGSLPIYVVHQNLEEEPPRVGEFVRFIRDKMRAAALKRF